MVLSNLNCQAFYSLINFFFYVFIFPLSDSSVIFPCSGFPFGFREIDETEIKCLCDISISWLISFIDFVKYIKPKRVFCFIN